MYQSKIDQGYVFLPIGKKLFDEFFIEWHGLGLIDENTLEPKYLVKLPPTFMRLPPWPELTAELKHHIGNRILSDRFVQLWAAYLKTNQIINFLSIVNPYAAAEKSAKANQQSELERYIYALWMHRHYKGTRGTRDGLITELALRLDNAVEKKHKGKRHWRFATYRSLLRTKSEKHPILKTATDMSASDIEDYATDGSFDIRDFPELLSAP